MRFDEYRSHDATGLAKLVAEKQIQATELLTLASERAASVNPKINAIVRDVPAAPSEDLTGPFAGVPFLIKDLAQDYAGLPSSNGSRSLIDTPAAEHATVVQRWIDAGLMIFGKTNLPEFGAKAISEPVAWGPARNPWNLAHTPGGSSGGSAAAVAAGIVPCAGSNDGGGSTRIPAACCGLVGLKHARGRISRGPDLGDSPLTAEGVLTRTVRETAELLDLLAGYEVGDATWAPPPAEPYADAMRRDPGRLRVAFSAHNALGAEVDPEARRGMEAAAELLESLGHEVEEAHPDLPGEEALQYFTVVFGAYISLSTLHAEMIRGRPPEDAEIEPLSSAMRAAVGAVNSYQYLGALSRLQQLARDAIGFFSRYDLLVTPGLAERPLAIGELTGCGEDPWADFARSARFTPYTALFNVTGQPAINVPMGLGPDGLPTCVQIVGRPICEDVLLQVAAQIEQARPWADLRSPLATAAV